MRTSAELAAARRPAAGHPTWERLRRYQAINIVIVFGALLIFCLGFSLICGVSCGLLPALWASRPQLLLELSSSGAHASAPRTIDRQSGVKGKSVRWLE